MLCLLPAAQVLIFIVDPGEDVREVKGLDGGDADSSLIYEEAYRVAMGYPCLLVQLITSVGNPNLHQAEQ